MEYTRRETLRRLSQDVADDDDTVDRVSTSNRVVTPEAKPATMSVSDAPLRQECKCAQRVTEAFAARTTVEKEMKTLQKQLKRMTTEMEEMKKKKSTQTTPKEPETTVTKSTSKPAVSDVPVAKQHQQLNFREIGEETETDKVAGYKFLPECLENPDLCVRKDCKRPECRPWGHFYDTMYQSRLGHLSTPDAEPFQFLEIGHFQGSGTRSFRNFFQNGEVHSMEISCLPHGRPEEGKWPFGNFAKEDPDYDKLLKAERLHCGDASKVEFLHKIWTEKMKRPDAPPLKIVVDDGAHVAGHMATTVFFWFPRIEPGGFLVVEDIQPISEANAFRTEFMPQILADVHYCGDSALPDEPCFPTLLPFLQSVHCEMHICVFTRNSKPAEELSLEDSTTPIGALDHTTCRSFQKN